MAAVTTTTTTKRGPGRAAAMRSTLAALTLATSTTTGCFLLVSSGVRRAVPEGARAAAVGLVPDDERVLAAWDGSLAQDGGLLVILTDRRVVKRDGDVVRAAPLGHLTGIVVDEDEGAVVLGLPEGPLLLPLRSSEERRAFAALVRDAWQTWLRSDDDGDGVRNALDGARDPAAR